MSGSITWTKWAGIGPRSPGPSPRPSPDRADIFIPEEEVDPAFDEAAVRTGSKIRSVARGPVGDGARLPFGEFEPNWRLARAVLESFGIDRRPIERGLSAAVPDPGNLRVWRGLFGQPSRQADCVSLFAANEPESSAAALVKVKDRVPFAGRPLVGLLSLREDRGDRTLQWVRAAGEGFFSDFSFVILVGPPAGAAFRKIRPSAGPGGPVFSVADARSPELLMARVMTLAPGEPVIVGLGNFVGPGNDLVRYWERIGTAHDR